MADLPKRPAQHVSRDQAILSARGALPAAWVVREEHQESDYGIDLEVEIAAHEVTGRLFKAQVRGHQEVPWTAKGDYLQVVRVETLNYWRALPVPVVLLVVDLRAEKTYWAWAKVAAGATGVRVERARVLQNRSTELANNVIDWLEQRGTKALR